MNNISEIILNTINEHNMLNGVKNIIVACSGGADSVALLHMLNSVKHRLNVNVQAAHLNHNVRGDASLKDALFVRQFCEKEHIAMHEKTIDWQSEMLLDKSENNLRNIRYNFFKELIEKEEKAVVATAHNKNDNAETLLLNITRGAGLNGACGIPYCRPGIIRPLLDVQRDDIENYLKSNNIEFCTDESNLTLDYSRNKIRLEVMPKLTGINEQAISSFARFISSAKKACDYIDEQANNALKQAEIINSAGEKGYSAQKLLLLHDAVLTKVCHMLISKHIDASESKISVLKTAIKNCSGSLELNKNITVSVSQGFVRELKSEQSGNNFGMHKEENESANTEKWSLPLSEIENSYCFNAPNGKILYINITNCEKTVNFKKYNKNHLKNIADYGKIKKDAIFRTIKAKDNFCAMFSNCTKPLKKVYSENKYSIELRQTNPVLADENTILWALGLGFAKSLMPDENTKKCIEINIKTPEVSDEQEFI